MIPIRQSATDRNPTTRRFFQSVASSFCLAATFFLGAGSAPAATNGVNLQPSYYNSGNVDFGWSLMNANTAIQVVRIEIEPGSETQAKSWIAQAKANGKTIIATYHHFPDNGSDSASALTTGGSWWVTNYAALSAAGSLQVNLMNEWGSHNQTSNTYASAYNSAISLVRGVYSGNIIIDIPGWGQEPIIAAQAINGTNGTKINDTNITLSSHVYPGAWNQAANNWLTASDLDTMASATGRTCMLGEFGTGSGSADWSGIVSNAASKGWRVMGWAWNGDGGVLNMVSPAWVSNPTATSFTTNSYFSTIYPLLGSGGGTVAVTGVSVSPTSASVGVGGTATLTATVSPSNATNKAVTWTSSNTAVATVSSSGVVTGVAAGSATITVKTASGSFTATAAITVSTGTVNVTGVTVSPTSASVAVGGTTTLTATVSPSNATNKAVTWTSSNTAVATVSSSGVVTGVATGSATITVRTASGGFTATSTITVTTGGGGTTVTVPFTKDGAGDFTYVTSGTITYINSWSLQLLTVNGVDCTNIYKSTGQLPARINGAYTFHYVSAVAWGHFEIR